MQPAEKINDTDEISLKELIQKLADWRKYLFSKWLMIVFGAMVGGGIGLFYAFVKKPVYKAVVTFALEDDKQSSGGLSGALGLASSLGIDLGTSAGGAFSGANLIELMKSRKIVQKALLNSFTKDNESKSLADVLLEMKDIKQNLIKKGIWRGESLFQVNGDPTQFNLQQDSIIGILFEIIAEPNSILSVSQRDKKVSIISVEVNSENERFSKLFSESIVKEVSDFYIETKSKKAKNNVAILQHQADSIRNELNIAIMGVAVTADNTFNLNPALNVNRIPSTKKQIDVQANTAILTQLVTNLEMAKVTLLRETPLIQIIDRPTLPLKKDEPGKAKFLLLGGLLFGFLSILYLIIKRILMQLDQ
jgi:uncharacterized protein involved in exopolysaccharide biosynthesis